MARDNVFDNLENVARNLDQRKPVFVDDKGQIHDAEKLSRRFPDEEHRPVTQLKPTTWF